MSGTSASVVAEGPLGRSRRGAWFTSVRQSYIDWLIRHIDTQNQGQTTFGFTDAQGKAVFDVTPRHQLQLTAVAGRSTLNDTEEEISANNVRLGRAATGMAVGAWRATLGSSLVLTQRVGWAGLTYRTRRLHQDLAEGRESVWTWRADAAYGLRRGCRWMPAHRWIGIGRRVSVRTTV